MYSSRRFGRTLTSMRASSSNACPDTIRSGCLCCIIRFAVPSAIVSAAHTPNSQSGLNGAQRAAPLQRQRATRRGRYDLLACSMTAMRLATTSQNSPRLLRASLRPQRFPPRVRRIPGSPARTPRPPRFPRATTALVSRSPRPRLPACLSTRPPCAPPSCAPRREFSSNARGRSRESPARVLRRSSPTGSSAPASAPRRKPKAASQKNAFPARRQIRIAPAHLPAHGCGSRGSLRCANRRERRTSRAAPARGSPRRPRQRAPDSVFFRQAVREAGQSSLASIAAFPSPVNATPRVQILTNQQVASRKRNRTYAVINPARKVASRSSSLGEKDMAQTNVQSTSHSTTISERAEMKPLTPNLNSLRAARPMASRKLMNTPNSPCTNPLPKTSLSVSGGCSNITGAPQSLRAMTRCSRSESSAAVFSNQFGLGKDVALHGAFNVGLRRAGFQTQFCVERIQLEEIAVRSAGRSYKTQCTHVPTGASGSSMMSAKLCVSAGGSFHFNCGETSGPSHVNFFGIASPAEKSGLEICSAIAPPFACEKSFPEVSVETQSKKPVRTATLLRTDIFPDSLLRGPVAAQKFGDFGMAALLRETERRLSVIGLGVQIRAARQQQAYDSQVAIGRGREERRVAISVAVIRVSAI